MIKLKQEIEIMKKCHNKHNIMIIDLLINCEEIKNIKINYDNIIYNNIKNRIIYYEQHNLLLIIKKHEDYNELCEIKQYLELTKHNLLVEEQIKKNNESIYLITQIHDIKQCLQSNNNNQNITLRLDTLREEICRLREDYIKLSGLTNSMKSDKNNLLKCVHIHHQLLQKLQILDKETKLYDTLILLTGMKGIPRRIINNRLILLENEVNTILSKFIQKTVYITKDIDDINIILISNNGIKCDFGGGMETFILTLAFKIALSEVFSSSKCGMLIIDENVSVLDKNHISKFKIISDFLKKYYNTILLITHIDGFQDYTIENINIHKIKTKAKVLFI